MGGRHQEDDGQGQGLPQRQARHRIFGQALNWGGGAKGGDYLSARAKKNGLTNDQQMWRDSGALSANEIARMNRSRGSGAPKIGVPGQEQKEKKFFGIF